jgi:hypothetical protein
MGNAVLRLAAPNAAVLRRFPLAVIAAAAIAGRSVLYEFGQGDWSSDPELAWRLAWSVVLLSSVAIGLFAEFARLRFGVIAQTLSLALGAAAWAAYGTPWMSPFWVCVALTACIALSAWPLADEQRYWSFNVRAAALAVFSFIAISVAVLGLIAIKLAIEYLFEVKLDWMWEGRIVTIGYFFLLPVYWCALLPSREDASVSIESDELLFKAVAAIGALVALVTAALAVLLHAYAARTVFEGALPKNQVGWIVSVFLAVGLFGWLAAAGQGGPADRLRRLYRRFWFPAAAVPTLLLAFAIWERVAAHGVTADRYTVGVAAWLFAVLIGLYAARRREPEMRLVALVGVVTAALAAVGPQNMPNTVAVSQIERLRALIARQTFAIDRGLAEPVTFRQWSDVDARRAAETMISAIAASGALDRLRTVAPKAQLDTLDSARRYFGVGFVPEPGRVVRFAAKPAMIAFDGWRVVGPIEAVRGNQITSPGRGTTRDIDDNRVTLEPMRLLIGWPGGEASFDLAPIVPAVDQREEMKRPIMLNSADDRALLVVQAVSFRKRDDGAEALSFKGFALIRER